MKKIIIILLVVTSIVFGVDRELDEAMAGFMHLFTIGAPIAVLILFIFYIFLV